MEGPQVVEWLCFDLLQLLESPVESTDLRYNPYHGSNLSQNNHHNHAYDSSIINDDVSCNICIGEMSMV